MRFRRMRFGRFGRFGRFRRFGMQVRIGAQVARVASVDLVRFQRCGQSVNVRFAIEGIMVMPLGKGYREQKGRQEEKLFYGW